MKNRIEALFILLFILMLSRPAAAAENPSKIGRIDLTLLAVLHPQMANFDYQAMGFLKVPMGLTYEERQEQIKQLQNNTELRATTNKKLYEAEAKVQDIRSQICRLLTREKIVNLQDMSAEAAEEYNELQQQKHEAERVSANLRYSSYYPEFTSPDETQKRLELIDQELMSAVQEAAEQQKYDVVLNASLPVPFGYPVKYNTESKYYTGPEGIQKDIYYAILAEPPKTHEQGVIAESLFNTWVKGLSKPEVKDYLPIKPRPLVLSGGQDLLPAALKILYSKYNISDESYDFTTKLLKEKGLISQQ